MIGLSFREREALIAFAIGSVIAFGLNIWFNAVAKPESIDSYLWLARLQEPGTQVGERIVRSLYPVVGHSWNVYLAIPCAYGVLIVLWTLATFPLIRVWRSAHNAFSRN